MRFRKALEKDSKEIIKIINQAKEYFKEVGIDQWQNGYPDINTVLTDIKLSNSYVLDNEDTIIGTVAVIFEKEKSYEKIYNGNWISTYDYVTIHRIAIDSKYKGLGISSIIIKEVIKLSKENSIKSIRIDTHKDNKSMIRLLEKNNFKYCGVIYLEDNSERIAFEKLI